MLPPQIRGTRRVSTLSIHNPVQPCAGSAGQCNKVRKRRRRAGWEGRCRTALVRRPHDCLCRKSKGTTRRLDRMSEFIEVQDTRRHI